MSLTAIIIIVVAVLVAVGIAFIAVPYLLKRGLLSQGSIDVTKQVLDVAESILSATHIGNDDKNHQIFTVCEKVVLYIEQTMKEAEPEGKKAAAEKMVEEALSALNIEVSDKVKTLIEIGIESTVKLLPKTYS